MARIGTQTAFLPLTDSAVNVAYTGTHGVMATAIGEGIREVLVTVTTDAYISIGAAPVADTGDTLLFASTYTFRIHKGKKISAVQFAAGGTLSVTPLTQ